jgi:hypothetical protein
MGSGPVVPIIAAAVAAIVSVSIHFLTRRSETIKHVQSLRTAAYVDFIRGVSALASIAHEPVQSKEHFMKEWESRLLLADAKSRIAIYGSKAVVSSLANFLRGGVLLDSPERMKAFTGVCQTMRTDSRPGPGSATDQDVHFLLFDADMNNKP